MSELSAVPAYNMLGRTRSGGRWPSMKVLMLMMTFSPISTRPSMRRRAHMRQQDDIAGAGKLDQLGIDRRLMLEHVEPGAGNLVRLDQPGQRILVDDLAARRVDDERPPAAAASACAPRADDRSPAYAGN